MLHLILLILFIGSIIHIACTGEKEGKSLTGARIVFWILLILNCISFWVWLIGTAIR